MEGDSISHSHVQTPRNVTKRASAVDSTRIWITVGAVAALLALGACIALIAISISKRRLLKQQLEEARQWNPCLQRKEFSKKRRMTQNDRMLEAEEQRQAMIRKSLASRSGRSMSSSSNLTFDSTNVSEPETTPADRHGPREKSLSRQHSRSRSDFTLYDEKSWEVGRPLSRASSPFPDPPAPTLSRSSSPGRLPQAPANRPDLPPLLEQHPLFQRLNDNPDSENEHR